MKKGFKRVPALDKGVRILELLAQSRYPLGLSEISKALGYHIGTVYNIVHTLTELGILDSDSNKRFSLGRKLHELGKAAGRDSELIQLLSPRLLSKGFDYYT